MWIPAFAGMTGAGLPRCDLCQPHRHALRAPRPGSRLEHARAGGMALAAAAVVVEIPRGDDVPVAADEFCAAVVAIGAAAGFVVDVAGVHIAQAVVHGDVSRSR